MQEQVEVHHDVEQPVHLPCCNVFTFNDPAEHRCPVYDGPACSTCGEPTLFYTVGAPGYGSGRVCKNQHREQLTAHGIFTPEQTR